MMNGDLCYTIKKYSHITATKIDKNGAWTHVTAPDLAAIITIDANQLQLRIIRASTTLESVDLLDYINQALFTRRKSIRDGTILEAQQLPIHGVSRDSAFAMMFRLPNNQFRGIQLRLSDEATCQQLVKHLVSAGLEMRPAPAGSGPRSRPASSLSAAALSMYSVPPQQQLPVAKEADHGNSRNISSTVTQLQQSLEASSRHTRPLDYLPTPAVSTLSRYNLRQSVRASSTTPCEDQSRAQHTRPAESAGLQHDHRNRQLDDLHSPHVMPAEQSVSYSTASAHEYSYQASEIVGNARDASSSDAVSVHSMNHDAHETTSPRMPPRRQLPFPRSATVHGEIPRPSSTPVVSSAKPGVFDSFSRSSNHPNVTSHDLELKLPKLVTTRPVRELPRQPLGEMAVNTATRRPLTDQAASNSRHSVHTYSDEPEAKRIRLSSSIHATDNADDATTSRMYQAVAETMTQNTSKVTNLADWSAASREDRQAALDEFMLAQIDDPSFAILCKDVGQCWRRITLGL